MYRTFQYVAKIHKFKNFKKCVLGSPILFGLTSDCVWAGRGVHGPAGKDVQRICDEYSVLCDCFYWKTHFSVIVVTNCK